MDFRCVCVCVFLVQSFFLSVFSLSFSGGFIPASVFFCGLVRFSTDLFY